MKFVRHLQTEQRAMMKPPRLRKHIGAPVVAGLLSLFTIALLVAGCTSPLPKATPAPVKEEVAATPAEFVGSAACEECHADIVKIHATSGHAQALHPMNRQALGRLAPPDGPVPGINYAIITVDGNIGMASPKNPTRMAAPLHLAFGSGRSGMTYAGVLRSEKLAEMRMSYFPKTGKWYITPGQEGEKNKNMGKIHGGEFPRLCVLCHAVAVSSDSLVPEPRFMGVGCESCHGAGSAHIAAMRSGKAANSLMEPLKQANGTKINALCGKCHGTAEMVKEHGVDASETNRYQPYGLSLSKCFQKSGGALSCVSCHDPHTNVSSDTKKYEAVCISCHQDGKSASAKAVKTCPINKKSGCVNCHMPRKDVFKGVNIPMQMPDHYIRVHR